MTGYVALEAGPLDGWWYTAGDWETCRTAAERMGRTADLPQGRVLGYQETQRTIPHKRMDMVATVWRWAS